MHMAYYMEKCRVEISYWEMVQADSGHLSFYRLEFYTNGAFPICHLEGAGADGGDNENDLKVWN